MVRPSPWPDGGRRDTHTGPGWHSRPPMLRKPDIQSLPANAIVPDRHGRPPRRETSDRDPPPSLEKYPPLPLQCHILQLVVGGVKPIRLTSRHHAPKLAGMDSRDLTADQLREL